MGQSATAFVCFGLTLEREAFGYDEDAPKGSPAYLWANGARKGDEVQIVTTCVEGNEVFVVAIRTSVVSAEWHQPVDLTAKARKAEMAVGLPRPDWVKVLTQYVEQWGLADKIDRKVHPKGAPSWLLAAHFG